MERNNLRNPQRHAVGHRGFSHAPLNVNSSPSKSNEDKALVLSGGDRVHLSELGRSRHPRDTEKKGTIVGSTRYPNSLRIVWDGSRWPIAVHRDYLQLLNEGSQMPMNDQDTSVATCIDCDSKIGFLARSVLRDF
jgi:hypothetical protein